MRMLKLPDERIRVLVQGVCRARVKEFTAFRPHLTAKIERIADQAYDGASIEKEALVRVGQARARARLEPREEPPVGGARHRLESRGPRPSGRSRWRRTWS